jgi:twitching motility protein PilT
MLLLVMSELLRDSDLDRLINELNRRAPATGDEERVDEVPWAEAADGLEVRLEPALSQATVPGSLLDRLLAEMSERGASDLLLVAGMPPVFRVAGRLARGSEPPLADGELEAALAPHLGAAARRKLETRGAADLMVQRSGGRVAWRFRVNVHRQRGRPAAAVRALPVEVPTLQSLRLPAQLVELVRPTRGLVLVCGPTGSGKSSTLAALVGEVVRARACHVITIEDPVEFEHCSDSAVIEHIEIGRDSPSFAAALRAALRQDPDVILVGEMRDLETTATALTAAETGHLVLGTLHTNDAAQAVRRVVDVFPAERQGQIRHQLALALHAVLVQQLLPFAGRPGRVPAVELLLANYGVRNHIRTNQVHKLRTEISLGRRHGMISFEQSLADLVRAGAIEMDEARIRASHPEELEALLSTGQR